MVACVVVVVVELVVLVEIAAEIVPPFAEVVVFDFVADDLDQVLFDFHLKYFTAIYCFINFFAINRNNLNYSNKFV